MKTTVYFDDAVYRQAKAVAALEGKPFRQLLDESLREHIAKKTDGNGAHWLDRLPRLTPQAAASVDEFLNEADFRKIDPEMWS